MGSMGRSRVGGVRLATGARTLARGASPAAVTLCTRPAGGRADRVADARRNRRVGKGERVVIRAEATQVGQLAV